MKLKFLLLTLSGGFASLLLSSYNNGAAFGGAGNRTGGPGSSGLTCAAGGCHSSGSATTISIALRKKSDNSAAGTQYNAGATYIVTVTGNNSSLNNFGFQAMALKSDNTNAGAITSNSNVRTVAVSGITLAEQRQVLAKTSGSFTAEFDWTAPESGTGTVTFYGILNAVNNNGNSSGDAVSQQHTLVLSESPTSVEDVAANKNINIYPNPVSNALNVSFSKAVTGKYSLAVYDLKGQKVISQNIDINNSSVSVPAHNLAGGLYHLVLTNGNEKHTVPFVKQ